MDDERLKNPDGRPDHFDEMWSASATSAHRRSVSIKVRDLFALSSDTTRPTKLPSNFSTVQNLMLYAVTQNTAAELITDRANPNDPHFGLLTKE